MFMDGVVDNVAAKQEIDIFSPKTWKRADMTVYRAVGSGCEIGSVAGELRFFCEKSMLQQWVILVKKRFGQLLLLPHSEMYKYVLAPGVILSVEGWSRNSSRGNSPLLDPCPLTCRRQRLGTKKRRCAEMDGEREGSVATYVV